MRIYLVGYMGSGKSTIAKALATYLDVSYSDTDAIIEKNIGLSIKDIFESRGEAYFRTLESQVIRENISTSKQIISTGGGLPTHSDNMEYMNNIGITVYLKLSPLELANRLRTDNARPLLANRNEDELQKFVQEHLSTREYFYEKAHFIVDGALPPDQISEAILNYYYDCISRND